MVALGLEVVLGFLDGHRVVDRGRQAARNPLPTGPWLYRGQNVVNLSSSVWLSSMVGILVVDPGSECSSRWSSWSRSCSAVMLVIRIGGADMPTVISLLNSYAGLSASMMGFVLDNNLLIVAGALDGSSGLVLSIVMCQAMNRSFANVLFGGFGATSERDDVEARPVRSDRRRGGGVPARRRATVVIVPGYGMAAAQAQHKVRELSDALQRAGST